MFILSLPEHLWAALYPFQRAFSEWSVNDFSAGSVSLMSHSLSQASTEQLSLARGELQQHHNLWGQAEKWPDNVSKAVISLLLSNLALWESSLPKAPPLTSPMQPSSEFISIYVQFLTTLKMDIPLWSSFYLDFSLDQKHVFEWNLIFFPNSNALVHVISVCMS